MSIEVSLKHMHVGATKPTMNLVMSDRQVKPGAKWECVGVLRVIEAGSRLSEAVVLRHARVVCSKGRSDDARSRDSFCTPQGFMRTMLNH